MDDLSRVTAAEGVLARQLDDSVLLLHPQGGQAVSLNETAAAVWRRCAAGSLVAELVTGLASDYGVPERQIRHEVAQTVENLLDLGFLQAG